MKIICTCGCEINQPITSVINGVSSIKCINCKKDIAILVLDEQGLKNLTEKMD